MRKVLRAFGSQVIVASLLLAVYEPLAQGEPWLGTRFAQNCSGCHAPGRRNLPPSDRRCSLSCQGCHVNPNGGGLRSHYGKWTEEKWLRSWRTKFNKPRHATLQRQKYYISTREYKAKKAQKKIDKSRKIVAQGYPLVYSKSDFLNENFYDRYHDNYYDKLAWAPKDEFLYTIPKEDPYRQMFDTKVDGGGDVRIATLKRVKGSDNKDTETFIMSADFGLRWRPIHKKVHVVYESRFMGGTNGNPIDDYIGTESTRSLYLMVDDLPYNVFVMGGYYKPIFGNYTPDHYALSQIMIANTMNGGKPYAQLFKAFSVGTAPNVPYANLHYIAKDMTIDQKADETTGFAVNLGLRFVSYGASVNYSVWSTENNQPTGKVKVLMHSAHILGAVLDKRLILGLELLSLERDDPATDFRRGGVYAFESKLRLWRENYLTLDYATANTAPNLLEGSATQTKIGIKSFIIPGLEYSLQYSMDDIELNGESFSTANYLSMIHMYF